MASVKSRDDVAATQVFRRERSFVLQRPQQPSSGQRFQQQRERSFVRDGNRQQAFQNVNNGQGSSNNKSRIQQATNPARAKPNMEIYRPPSLRSGDVPVTTIPPAAPPAGNRVSFHGISDPAAGSRLAKSRTWVESSTPNKTTTKIIQMAPVANPAQTDSSSKVQHFALQRSKSSGSQLELQNVIQTPPSTAAATIKFSPDLPDVSAFPQDVQLLLRKVASDPNHASSRSVMDAVRHVFVRVVESSRYASTGARYCSYVIEKETNETFLESLLNACQEWFQERDRLLRSSSQRWVAFINFLNEMYIQLKRRQHHTTTKPKAANGMVLSPTIILLSILAECCCVILKQPSSHSLQELECLFFVMTGIGRDLEQEIPAKMATIMAAIRDAFLETSWFPVAAQRTLLQLVELRAAKWQLPATAVTYYYPSASGTVAY